MVNKPFPALCSTAKAMMAEGPIAISTSTVIAHLVQKVVTKI
jgi:hypothetical protein